MKLYLFFFIYLKQDKLMHIITTVSLRKNKRGHSAKSWPAQIIGGCAPVCEQPLSARISFAHARLASPGSPSFIGRWRSKFWRPRVPLAHFVSLSTVPSDVFLAQWKSDTEDMRWQLFFISFSIYFSEYCTTFLGYSRLFILHVCL